MEVSYDKRHSGDYRGLMVLIVAVLCVVFLGRVVSKRCSKGGLQEE